MQRDSQALPACHVIEGPPGVHQMMSLKPFLANEESLCQPAEAWCLDMDIARLVLSISFMSCAPFFLWQISALAPGTRCLTPVDR